MAKIFLAYHDDDRELARKLEQGLSNKGHQSVWGVDEFIAGRGWGELMPRRIARADAVIALLTPASVGALSVWCEIGAARALSITERHTALLPIVLDLPAAPKFTEDILVLRATQNETGDLVDRIDSAVRAHLAAVEAEATRTVSPKIFISHRHKDQAVAHALSELLVGYFQLSPQDIRCTSVQPYRLPFGKNTGERLRDEISRASVVLGILSPDTSESSYVMFELGAAWSQRIYTCPLLSKGAEYGHIPGPIFDLAPARLWQSGDCNQLLDNLKEELALTVKPGVGGAVSDRVAALNREATPV